MNNAIAINADILKLDYCKGLNPLGTVIFCQNI